MPEYVQKPRSRMRERQIRPNHNDPIVEKNLPTFKKPPLTKAHDEAIIPFVNGNKQDLASKPPNLEFSRVLTLSMVLKQRRFANKEEQELASELLKSSLGLLRTLSRGINEDISLKVKL